MDRYPQLCGGLVPRDLTLDPADAAGLAILGVLSPELPTPDSRAETLRRIDRSAAAHRRRDQARPMPTAPAPESTRAETLARIDAWAAANRRGELDRPSTSPPGANDDP